MVKRLERGFYLRDVVTVARSLLGQRLVRVIDGQRLAGLIVETEAYLGVRDAAAHTFQGRRTARNASMWGPGGHAYVYFTYGMHFCLNVVAGEEGVPVAALVRGLEPVEGLELMYQQRRRAQSDTDLCSGPGKLCQAMQITRQLDGADLVAGHDLFIEHMRTRALPSRMIGVGPRIGVAYAGPWARKPLRFWVLGHPHVTRSLSGARREAWGRADEVAASR